MKKLSRERFDHLQPDGKPPGSWLRLLVERVNVRHPLLNSPDAPIGQSVLETYLSQEVLRALKGVNMYHLEPGTPRLRIGGERTPTPSHSRLVETPS